MAVLMVLSFAVAVIPSPAQAVVSHDPRGTVEYAGWNGSSVTMAGWAFDPDSTASSEQIFVRTGSLVTSPLIAITRTTILRTDVNAVFHIGGYHGWKVNFLSASGPREFCAFAVNIGLGSTRLIGCRFVAVPYVPEGHLDAASISGGAVTMSGWALDRDALLSAVRIQVFEASATSNFVALLNTTSTTYLRADVNQVLHVVGNHGWRTTFTLSGGIHKMCAYALNVGLTAPNKLLGCTSLTTSYTWTGETAQMDPVRGGVGSLTCRTAQACIMTDDAGALHRYDGTNWAPMAGPGNGVGLYGIDCLSATFCMAIDGYNAWRFDGSAWTEYAIPIQYPFPLSVVSCGSPTFCIAKARANQTMWVFDGTRFRPTSVTMPVDLTSTSCFDSGHCMDAEGEIFDGTNWSAPASGLPFGFVDTPISCASSTFCIRIDGKTVQTYDGTSWQPGQTVDTARLADVSCMSSTSCLATDAGGGAVVFDGTNWTATAPVDPSRAVSHTVRCASATLCIATDGYQLMRFDGSTWGAPTLLQDFDGGSPNGLSCASATMCVAIDPSGHAIKYDGTAWGSAQRIVPEGSTLAAVSCPSSTWCAAVSDSGVLTYDGTTWTAQAGSSGVAGSSILTCTSESFCVATQPRATSVWVYRGSGWSNESLPISEIGSQNSLSCVSSTFCIAAGGGNFARFDGASWQALPRPAGGVYINYVACSSVHFCLVTDGSGSFRVYSGSTLSAPVSVGNSADAALACPIDGLCAALDSYGTFDEISASPISDVSKVTVGYLRPSPQMSCPTASFCMVFDSRGLPVIGRVPA